MNLRHVLTAAAAVLALSVATLKADRPDFNRDPDSAGKFTPIQLAFATPMQIAPESWDVMGLRLNLIYGSNHNVTFLDVGLLNHTINRQTGIQVAGIWNGVEGEMSGIQVAGILNSAGNAYMMSGIQAGSINLAGDATGLQVGVFNNANSMQGMQVGVVNNAATLQGVQIGLINLITAGPIPFMPVLNVGF